MPNGDSRSGFPVRSTPGVTLNQRENLRGHRESSDLFRVTNAINVEQACRVIPISLSNWSRVPAKTNYYIYSFILLAHCASEPGLGIPDRSTQLTKERLVAEVTPAALEGNILLYTSFYICCKVLVHEVTR